MGNAGPGVIMLPALHFIVVYRSRPYLRPTKGKPRGKGGKRMPQGIIGLVVVVIIIIVVPLLLGVIG